jgi:xylulose-5-phosphate/fructose-6-phosphate phosphoketolase
MACRSKGTFRAHQVPLLVDPEHPDHVKLLESWMKSYKAEELFDDNGRLMPELAELAPKGRPQDGRQSARQRRNSPARPAHA